MLGGKWEMEEKRATVFFIFLKSYAYEYFRSYAPTASLIQYSVQSCKFIANTATNNSDYDTMYFRICFLCGAIH